MDKAGWGKRAKKRKRGRVDRRVTGEVMCGREKREPGGGGAGGLNRGGEEVEGGHVFFVRFKRGLSGKPFIKELDTKMERWQLHFF